MSEQIKPELYTTLEGEGHDEFEERRSLFIGHAKHVTSEEEAMEFVKSLKKEYSDATHNVWAYVLKGGLIARYYDDGEPHGTSGVPRLNVLKMSGACDLCVVITRYFGGILLGAGGLVRAYSAAAKLAIDAAGLAVFEPWDVLLMECSYSDYQKLTSAFVKIGVTEENVQFGASVLVQAAVEAVRTEQVCALISEMTGGRVIAEVVLTEERASRRSM